jgi:hypothetical protein
LRKNTRVVFKCDMWSPLMTGRLNLIDQELFRCESELQYLVEAQEGGVGNKWLGVNARTDRFFCKELNWDKLITFFSEIRGLFEGMTKRQPTIQHLSDYGKTVVLSETTPYRNDRYQLTWLLEHDGEKIWCKQTHSSGSEKRIDLVRLIDLRDLLSMIYHLDTDQRVEITNTLSAAVIFEYKGW